MTEKDRHVDPQIISSKYTLPSNASYESLIATYGGKAAGLLWVKKHLPEIPMAKMLALPAGVSLNQTLNAIFAQGLNFPILVRSSSPLDNLPGYEGVFPTLPADTELELSSAIHHIKSSYPDQEGPVIIAEKSPGKLVGTLVAHPNQDNYFIAIVKDPYDTYALFFVKGGQVHRSIGYSMISSKNVIPPQTTEIIQQVVELYSKIISLPSFSQSMTYQIEFGVDPFLFFQVRDFLPVQKAGFEIPDEEAEAYLDYDSPNIVFGLTPEAGLTARVNQQTRDGELGAFMGEVGDVRFLKSTFALYLIKNAGTILGHEEIRAIRQSQLTVYDSRLVWIDPDTSTETNIKTNDRVRVISDGMRAKVEKINP
ncbi:MAG TPA: hypothetical protein VD999_07015 [Vitreimonas sp.]|nr:hypothetical protein [Vitreimonas sp.]